MKYLDNTLFFIIISYPLFYSIGFIREDLGHFFEVIFFGISGFLILMISVGSMNFRCIKKLWLWCIGVLFVWLLGFSDLESLRPYFSLLLLLCFLIYSSRVSFWNQGKIKFVNCYIFLFLILSFIMLFFNFAYIDDGARFKSFSLSPTHYSVYCLILGVFISISNIKKTYKYVLYFILAAVVFYTGTRLSLAVLLLLYAVYFFRNILDNNLVKYSLLIFAFFAFAYPIYEILNGYLSISELRYEGEDKSLTLRLMMQGVLLDGIANNGFIQFLLGNGSEAARAAVDRFFDSDLQSHNDFLRLFYDFGIIGFISYILVILYLGSKNIYTLCILIIYLSGFYHNMVYSSYLLACLCFFYSYKKTAVTSKI